MENMNIYNKLFGFMDIDQLFARIFMAAVIFVAFKIVAVILYKKSHFINTKILKINSDAVEQAITDSFIKPICLFLQVTGIFLAVRSIPFSAGLWLIIWPLLVKFYRISIILVVAVGLVNLVSDLLVLSPSIKEHADKTVFGFISKLLKGIIVAFALAAFLTELNFDISGIIAGLGLSGIVLALAAQDTASNFFSGVVILFDKPFAVGDWISVAGMEGVVEEMNFRSCRIRTFDNALISVPNSKLSGDSVTNWQKMELRKAKITFGLTYSTDKETLQAICEEIKEKLLTYENIKTDSILVWFDKFNASSLDICVQYQSYLTGFATFVKQRETVQYMIMETVEKHKSDFAFDTKTIIIENQ